VATPSAAQLRGGVGDVQRGPRYAFGLRLDSDLPLRSLPLGENDVDRETRLVLADAPDLEAVWPRKGAETLFERRTPSGRLVMSVDADPKVGYRVVAPGYGRHLVSTDGTQITSSIPAITSWRWQRLLFAQVLPLAATLQRLELLHASAVARDGWAFAFVATSGTGKSSVAAHLVARGAKYVTDDVLALEATDGAAIAHPGAAVASIHRGELRALGADAARAVGTVVGRSDKLVVAIDPVETPQMLGAVYFLERTEGGRFAIERAEPPDPRLLLSSTFISYLRTPEFLVSHLDAAASIASATPLLRVKIPKGWDARDVAVAIERNLETLA
jgi:hypothetical protein